jgi:hypothetical protein
VVARAHGRAHVGPGSQRALARGAGIREDLGPASALYVSGSLRRVRCADDELDFRPPYGETSDTLYAVLANRGYKSAHLPWIMLSDR